MKILRTSAVLATLGLAALAGSPAQADLIIGCSGQSGCSADIANSGGPNTFAFFTGTLGAFKINVLTITGQDDLSNPSIQDDGDLSLSSKSGNQSITFDLTQTDLNAGAVLTTLNYMMKFSAAIDGNLSDARTFYIDPTNNGGLTDNLGGTINAQNITKFASESLSGLYSITEVISITAHASGAELSSDDKIQYGAVPEPATLGLLGTGLVAFGAMRRRRKAAKAA
jgi:hypothetical protein